MVEASHGWLLKVTLCLVAFSLCTAIAVGEVYTTPEQARASEVFRLQGEYTNAEVGVQVIALGQDEYRVVIFKGGLPGAGSDGKDRQELDETSTGVQAMIESLELEKVERVSPTLGANAPRGAIVLFDGSRESLEKHWRPGAQRTDDGLLMQGATSIETFRDYTIHLEFRTSFMPEARGQARANSGLYHQGRYETQILDSFGLEGKNNETGGIYTVRDPDVNMCLPPLSWQTYDVDFTAARWDESGNKVSNARMTVMLNGVVVQRDVEVSGPTRAAPLPETPEGGPIYLQDHGDQIRFRNIWVLPRDAEREALRPIVPAFERFHTSVVADSVVGGRLLLGELACTKCHAADKGLQQALLVKEPPILTEVGSRLHPEWIRDFLVDPHSVKPGTTMPQLLGALPPEEREQAATALTNFLLSTGRVVPRMPDRSAAQRGAKLFHEIGCVQCHAPRDGRTVPEGSSVPLAEPGAKYSYDGLKNFLKNPHQVRPSGRMPGWPVEEKLLDDLTSYLIGEVSFRPLNPNVMVEVYHGNWSDLPDFASLTPVHTGPWAGLDVSAGGRADRFGLVFSGYLPIEHSGKYRFHLGSDDGSRLTIGETVVVTNGGIHPHTEVSGDIELDKGVHPIRVEYFEQGGEESLTLQFEGPRTPRQDVSHRLQMTPDGNPEPEQPSVEEDLFVFDPQQVERGRELFATIGCASCHELKVEGAPMASKLAAPPLADCRTGSGCLQSDGAPGTPQYDLAPLQQFALEAVIARQAEAARLEEHDIVHQTMLSLNCYACHARGGVGGPTRERDPLFVSTIPEMGDEGRLPPPLDGVGDKLRDDFLRHVLNQGGDDRPYMKTRMPKFGAGNVRPLLDAVVKLDRRTEAELARFDEPLYRVKATGRQLVGDQALACIKCHTFGNHRATGIQAINLQAMPGRLREDWFLRYLYDPNAYRPGTRMPTGFPEGQATVRDIYHGDPNKQISAIWLYLQDGSKAGVPDGLIARMIELKPKDRPIIYRNFIEGLSPRGIAVGYPELAHLAWDANFMALRLVWHGRFIDASRHWEGRGQGFQPPLGDHILRLEETVPVAKLASADVPWPDGEPRDAGYRFLGYRLNKAGQPTFRYSGPGFTVEDFPEPRPGEPYGSFRRHLTVTQSSPGEPLYFRAGTGQSIESLSDGHWLVDGAMVLQVSGGGTPVLRQSGGRHELIVPVPAGREPVTLIQEIVW